MPAAHVLGLDHQDAHRAGQPGGKAGAGNAAAGNQDIKLLHLAGWLRFGKARRLEVL